MGEATADRRNLLNYKTINSMSIIQLEEHPHVRSLRLCVAAAAFVAKGRAALFFGEIPGRMPREWVDGAG